MTPTNVLSEHSDESARDMHGIAWSVIICWALVAVVAIRSEHLIASFVWICLRGTKVYRRKEWRKATTHKKRWKVYKANGGGKWPWLFFGIKAHRLRNVEPRRNPKTGKPTFKARLAKAVRVAWVYPAFGLGVPPLLILLSETTSPKTSNALMVAALILVFTAIIIAVEGGVCVVNFGSWGDTHHRLDDEVPRMREAKAFGGSFLIALVATLSLLWVAATRFDAFPSLVAPEGNPVTFANVLQAGLAAMVQNLPDATGVPMESYVAIPIRILWIAYALGLLCLIGWTGRAK